MTKKYAPPTGMQIAGFSLYQNIGMEIEDIGRSISLSGVFFPVFHEQVKDDLEKLKRLSDMALEKIEMAKTMWEKEREADQP